LGILLERRKEHNSAARSFRKATKISPNDARLHANLGMTLRTIDKKKSVQSLEKCLEIDPTFLDAFTTLGCVLNEMGNYSGAKNTLQRALDLDPRSSDAHHNLAVNYSHLANGPAAIRSLKRAMKYASPDNIPKSEMILGMELLKVHNFKDGWRALEARWGGPNDSTYLNTSRPKWDLTRKNDRVFLWEEQGLGDLIMYSSMIEELRNSVGQLIVQVDQRLIHLFQRSFSKDIRFIAAQRKVFEIEYDSHIPIGSLPLHFRPELSSFKKQSGRYLKHNAELTKKIKSKLQKDDKRKIYGISWRGGSLRHTVNKNKSIELENLVKIFNHKEVQLVSLQYGDTSQELETLAKNHGIEIMSVNEICNLENIDGLASLICACDQVVSMDNTTVFLAGALGRPTNVLVPFTSDWRWGERDVKRSYWHSSLRLYRQKKVGDWSYPLTHLKADLDKI
jgi:tetratricopeptide (TPR) repeat protein